MPFVGVTAAGWLIGTYAVRAAAQGSCDDFGQRGCTGDDFGPSLIGLAGLVLLLGLIAAAVVSGVARRRIPAFGATLLYASAVAILAARTEPASDAGWYIPTATALALIVLLAALAAFGAGERGRPNTAAPQGIPTPAGDALTDDASTATEPHAQPYRA